MSSLLQLGELNLDKRLQVKTGQTISSSSLCCSSKGLLGAALDPHLVDLLCRALLDQLGPTFFKEEAFFAGAIVFLELSRLVFNLPVHKVGVFRVFFFARAALALAEEAGALVEVLFAAFLIPGLEVEAFLAPALAAFLEAAAFGGAILLTSDLFAGQRETVKKLN